MDVAASSAACGAAFVGLGLLLLREREPDAAVTLAFPPDLAAAQVETLLGLVAGLPARSRVTSIVDGVDGEVRFALRARLADLHALRAGVEGFAPGIRLGDPPVETGPGSPGFRAHLSWRGTHVLLRRDQPELAVASLLGTLRSASAGERVQLRVGLRPVVRASAPRLRSGQRDDRSLVSRTVAPQPTLPADQLRQIRQQFGGPLLGVRLQVLVWASTVLRARQLLARVVAVLRARSGVRGRLSVRSHRFARAGFGTMLAPADIVPLLGWPLDGPVVPGLALVRSPQLLPDRAVPTRGGRLFGVSSYPGMERREIRQPGVGARSHTLLVGPTGSGKSSLLTRLLLDDINAGLGVCLVDLKGDTVRDVLSLIPKRRVGDVVVLDPSDARPLPGLKAISSEQPELTTDLWVGLFRSLFADSWGVRTERYLRLGFQTLTLLPGATILDLPRVFSDQVFRERLVRQAREPFLSGAWGTFDALSPGQQAEHLAPTLGKVQDVISRRVVRAVLGQTQPRITIAQAMVERQIVLARFAPGQLGAATAQLLGALTMYEIHQAVVAREGLAPEARTPFGVYVDEPAVLKFLPVPLDSLYELARGLGVAMTTATQSVSQLPLDVQRALLANAATIATFRAGADDARIAARELPEVTAEEIQHLGQYEIAVRLGLAPGHVTSTMTVRTLPLPEPCSVPDTIRDASARRYGVALEEASIDPGDAAVVPEDVPLGRRRRSA